MYYSHVQHLRPRCTEIINAIKVNNILFIPIWMLVLLLASRSEDQFDCTAPLNITSETLADGSCYGCPTRNALF